MYKKVLLVWLTLVLVLVGGLVGCAPGGEVKEEGGPIRVGVVTALTYIWGEHQWWGIQMAADEINEAGGVLVGTEKRTIELVPVDSNELYSIPDAVTAMERAITVEKVDFVIGGYRSESVLAMQEVAMDYKKIFIGAAGAVHPELVGRVARDYDRYKYFFRTSSNSKFIGEGTVRQLGYASAVVKKELGIEKVRVALLGDKAVFVDPIIASLKGVLPKLGMEVVGVWRPSTMATDLTAELTAIKAAEAHIIWVISTGPSGIVLSRQYGELKIPALIVGLSGEAGKIGHWETTDGNAEYIAAAQGFIPGVTITPTSEAFSKKFLERFGDYGQVGVTGYNAMHILAQAIERAGTLDNDIVVTALEETRWVSPIGLLTFYPPDSDYPHDLMYGPEYYVSILGQWQDGKLVTVWPTKENPAEWNLQYEGIVPLKLPPWMIEYWKKK